MTENVDFDAIVIGGGIMGTCSAYHLAKLGSKTLMLEQFEYGHKNGSSHGASRTTRIVHTSPMYLKLAQASYNEWNELSQSSKTKILEPSGLLWLDDEKNTRQRHEFLSKHSIEHELLHGPSIGERFQHLNYNNEWYAIYDPKAGILLADKCQEAAQKQFVKNGGTAHFSEKVLNITP
uniref:Sarcosine oxidasee (formaldehyde-forming) n=1 Tax=Acrobeloides nanus TaxID=290746 RepID=A0A914CN39_9BILA